MTTKATGLLNARYSGASLVDYLFSQAKATQEKTKNAVLLRQILKDKEVEEMMTIDDLQDPEMVEIILEAVADGAKEAKCNKLVTKQFEKIMKSLMETARHDSDEFCK